MEKGLFDQCVHDIEETDNNRCRAEVYDPTYQPCLIRQCTEKVNPGTEYGPLHKTKHTRYMPAKGPFKTQPISILEDAENLYLKIDRETRDKIKALFNQHRKLINALAHELLVMKEEYDLRTKNYENIRIEILEIERNIEQEKTSDMEDKKKIAQLEKRVQDLQQQLSLQTKQLSTLETTIDACGFALGNIAREVEKQSEDVVRLNQENKFFATESVPSFETQKLQLDTNALNEFNRRKEILEGKHERKESKPEEEEQKREFVPKKRKQGSEDEIRIRVQQLTETAAERDKANIRNIAAELEKQRQESEQRAPAFHAEEKEKVQMEVRESMTKGGNVYVVTRVRCGVKTNSFLRYEGDSSPIELRLRGIMEGQPDFILKENLDEDFVIFDDDWNASGEGQCSTFLSELRDLSSIPFQNALTYLRSVMSPTQYSDVLRMIQQWMNDIPYLADIEAFKERNPNAEYTHAMGGIEAAARLAKKKVTELTKNYEQKFQDAILNYMETKSHIASTILATNQHFLSNTIFNFITDIRDVDKPLPKTLSIFAIGPSGGGKTTTAKVLLRHVLAQYALRPGFVNDNITIIANAFEVAQQNNRIEIYKLKEYLDRRQETYIKPFLAELDANDIKYDYQDSTPSLRICGRSQLDKCKNLNDPRFSVRSFMSFLTFDRLTDRTRETKYTPNNPSGSSRSVKITQIMFIDKGDDDKQNNVLATINLVDTSGYERYELQNIVSYYVSEITNALAIDNNFQTYFKNMVLTQNEYKALDQKEIETYFKSPMSQINRKYKNDAEKIRKQMHPTIGQLATRFATAIDNERNFINHSLSYIQTDLSLLKQYHRSTGTRRIELGKEVKSLEQEGNGDMEAKRWLTTLHLNDFDSSVIVLGSFKPDVSTEEYFATKQALVLMDAIVNNRETPINVQAEENRFEATQFENPEVKMQFQDAGDEPISVTQQKTVREQREVGVSGEEGASGKATFTARSATARKKLQQPYARPANER